MARQRYEYHVEFIGGSDRNARRSVRVWAEEGWRAVNITYARGIDGHAGYTFLLERPVPRIGFIKKGMRWMARRRKSTDSL